jgi:hypothetical protein
MPILFFDKEPREETACLLDDRELTGAVAGLSADR